jgi:hypothetical protein
MFDLYNVNILSYGCMCAGCECQIFMLNTVFNTMLLYADDTSIVITESNATATKYQASSLLSDINSWFRNNLLLLNLNKTQYLEFRTKNYNVNELA